MSPEVYKAFQTILSTHQIHGPVLEVGAVAGPDCLLNLPAFKNVSKKIGVNLIDQNSTVDIEYVQINANDLSCFDNNYFQVVVCNSTLEHDPFFWKTLAEIKRVSMVGGLIVIGVPGYTGMGLQHIFTQRNVFHWFLRVFSMMGVNKGLKASTLTLGEHHFPNDYYRFSEHAVNDILLEGTSDRCVHQVMSPPRFIGVGYKK
jgi:SAM-dependent methyltransferase